jgi:hypothetical protein
MKKLLTTIMLAIGLALTATANPAERVQLIKPIIIQMLSRDGWQLAQESQSMLTFERRANAAQAILMNLGFSGASGTWAVERLSFTLIPQTDHYTQFYFNLSVNSQNAFGQMSSVPIQNKGLREYGNRVLHEVATKLPAQYRSAGVQPATSLKSRR